MVAIEEKTDKPMARRFALFDHGFRPFFLSAGIYAGWAVLGWVLVWLGYLDVHTALPQSLWHAHEMVFGFAAAAATGFLLTAVPNWTGSRAVHGPRLIVLYAVWLLARVFAWSLSGSSPALFAVADMAFLPMVGAFVGPGIILRNARRNGVFVVLIGVLTIANGAVHLQALGIAWASAQWGIALAIGILTLMISIVGGRIVPAFTIGGLRMAGRPLAIAPAPKLDLAAIFSVAAFVLAEAVVLPQSVVALLSLVAAFCNLARLLRWQSFSTHAVPLVWILHIGYAWLVVGLALKGLAGLINGLPVTAATHALTAGMAGTMILGVMSRASLGHTGRPLHADRWTVAAYLLVSVGAVIRVVGQAAGGPAQSEIIGASGLVWGAGFLLFAIRYLPWLIGPRPDGRFG